MFPSVGSAEPSTRRCAWIYKHSVGILIRFVKSEMILFLMKLSCVPQRCLQCLFIQYRINNVDYGGGITPGRLLNVSDIRKNKQKYFTYGQ